MNQIEDFINEFNCCSENPFVKSVISGFLIAISDAQGIILWASDEFCELTKYTSDELKGKSLLVLIRNSSAGDADHVLEQAIHNHLAWEGELSNEAKDGSSFWIKMSVRPVKSASGTQVGFLSLGTNITSSKKAEEEKSLAIDKALQSEKRYHAVIDDQTDLFCVYTGDGTRTYVNDRYCSFFNTTREHILGTNLYTYNPFAVEEEIIQKVKNLTQEAPQVMLLYEMKNGYQEWRFIVWRFISFFDKEGKPSEILAIGRDITEMKRAENQKNNYTEALEKIAFMTSHKVRGPIARSLGLLELIKISGFYTLEGETILQHFNTCITELDQYTRELADFIYRNQTFHESFISSQRQSDALPNNVVLSFTSQSKSPENV